MKNPIRGIILCHRSYCQTVLTINQARIIFNPAKLKKLNDSWCMWNLLGVDLYKLTVPLV